VVELTKNFLGRLSTDPAQREKAKKESIEAGGRPSKLSLASSGILKLAKELNIPFEVTKRASDSFKSVVQPPSGVSAADWDPLSEGQMTPAQFSEIFGKVDPKTGVSWEEALKATDANGDGMVDFSEFAFWYYSRGFSEDMVLTDTQRQTRDLARKLKISILDAENYKKVFDTVDKDCSGFIEYGEFIEVVYKLTKVPEGVDLPATRLQQLWRQADVDGSGQIDFEEFVIFYRKSFDHTSSDPIEDFYANVNKNLPM